MPLHRAHPRQQGFSMLEVLIAVLVFSLGMIGLAGLLIFAIQSNHVAYLRTQATFLAHNMADRMSANQAGLWQNDYNKSIDAAGTAVPSCAAGCSPADLATHDIAAWSQQLHTFLPGVAGSISCATTGVTFTPTADQQDQRPPYSGTCTMTLRWNEASATGGAAQASYALNSQGNRPHSFQWVFQP